MRLFLFILLSFLAAKESLAETPRRRRPVPVRTAVFEHDMRWKRGAVFADQSKIFDVENEIESKRPVWILGGDSLSASWANGGSMAERLKDTAPDAGLDDLIKGEERGDMNDSINHGPQAEWTWYAGSHNGGGVLERLSLLTGEDWLIIATALTGVNFLPQRSSEDDPIEMIQNVQQPERVRVVSFSLGSNDICGGVNPAAKPDQLRAKLQKMKEHFSPETVFAIWDLPDYAAYRAYILKSVKDAPASPQQEKIYKYCQLQWDKYRCSFARNKKSSEYREATRQVLREVFGELFTLNTQVLKPLEALGADCFHPSREMQTEIVDQFFAFIQKRGTLSRP